MLIAGESLDEKTDKMVTNRELEKKFHLSQSLATHIKHTVSQGVGLARSAILEARAQQRKLATVIAEKLEDVRTSMAVAVCECEKS